MVKNYIRVAWRTLTRYKVYSLINILGLSLGISACLVMWLITQYEFSFDKFQPDRHRIFRIVTSQQLTKSDPVSIEPSVIPPLPDAIRSKIRGIQTIAPYHILFDAQTTVPATGTVSAVFPSRPVVAGTEYFAIMPYEWLAGDAKTALAKPFQVVLTAKKAHQYFHQLRPEQMIGQELIYNDSLRVSVAGILKDRTENTDFPFEEFISQATADQRFLQRSLGLDQDHWKGVPYSSRVLLKLSPATDPAKADLAIAALFKQHWAQGSLSVGLQPLSEVHFTNRIGGNEVRTAHLPTLYALLSVALFILLLAIINYVNLATAQSLSRDKEIGIRKVLGGNRFGIVVQFLLETFVLTFFAVCLATTLTNPVLSIFRDFVPAGVQFHPFSFSTILFLASITLLTTLFAGIYPAGVLSSYLPALTLRGTAASKGGEKWWLRKGLIVFQFTISLVFIIGTIVVGRQIRFMQTKDLGFSSEAVISFSTNEDRANIHRVIQLANNIRQLPGVIGATRENMPPMGLDRGVFTIEYKPVSDQKIAVAAIKGDEYFIPFYNIHLLAGRNLLSADSLKEVVINESLSKMLGFESPDKAIGQSIYTWNKYCPIVGVVADFHQASLHESIKPMLIAGLPCTDIAVRLDNKNKTAEQTKAILSRIESQWKSFYPNTPFEYEFLDESLALLYKKEQTTAWLMNIATGITIFISCIGLFGLTLFTTQRRVKEIGIRKVLGADVSDIIVLLNKDFVVLVAIGLLIASPIAWLLMHRWLDDFAYRISIGFDIFLLAGIAILFITTLTISFQSLKSALSNPVKSLRTE